jgi:hypothetical protein
MKKQPIVLLFGLVLSMLRTGGLAGSESEPWKEVRLDGEVVVIRPAPEQPAGQGRIFAAKGKTTLIQIAPDLGEAGRSAAADIVRYLPLACGGQARVAGRKAVPHDFTLLLATSRSKGLPAKAGQAKDQVSLADQQCLIFPVEAFPDKTPGLALVGGSARGLLNGVYTLLEKSAGIYWEPARNLHPGREAPPSPAETILCEQEALTWTSGRLVWTPAVSDRILYIGFAGATQQAIDWASRNRLNLLVISTPHDLPMTESQEKHLKSTVEYAHDLGMKVLFLNMTHRLPAALRSLKPSSPEALKASTDLFVDLVSRFSLDGFAWHTASEGIALAEDEEYHQTPRALWEARYFNSYYSAIRQVKKNALLVMLMGWVYMNPASELARLLPADSIAWVVPNTPIIDAALTDIASYGEHFRHVWYWLYVTVSRDGAFPTVKLDYLEKYFAEAFKRGHGLAPQGVTGNNPFNAMYYVQVARDGLISHVDYLRSFAGRYYGDPRMGDALLTYQKALFHHRNWYNNIHTVDIRNYLTFEEAAQFKSVFESTVDAARTAKSPLLKDRLRTLGTTALRCILRRSPQPPLPGEPTKDWGPEWDRIYEKNRQEYQAMIGVFDEVFGETEAGAGAVDIFWEEYQKIKRGLKP